jgi:hypothetical protein
MKNHLINLLVIAFMLAACGQRTQTEEVTQELEKPVFLLESHQQFMNKLASLCGQAFEGAETYTIEGRENWQGKRLVMEVILCDPDRVHISLAVDENRSRTWMFMAEDGFLRFRHDHRHEDGTAEEVTLYGGYATNAGNALVQYFPADEYTCQLIDYACKNEWVVMLSDDMSKFSYILSLDGVMRFQADFDLTNPL